MLKKDYWMIFECSLEICGHEFDVKTGQFGCEFSSGLFNSTTTLRSKQRIRCTHLGELAE